MSCESIDGRNIAGLAKEKGHLIGDLDSIVVHENLLNKRADEVFDLWFIAPLNVYFEGREILAKRFFSNQMFGNALLSLFKLRLNIFHIAFNFFERSSK